MAMSAARPGAAAGSVRSASRAISVSTMMFFFSTVTSSVSACAKATTTCGWPAAMVRLRVFQRARGRRSAVPVSGSGGDCNRLGAPANSVAAQIRCAGCASAQGAQEASRALTGQQARRRGAATAGSHLQPGRRALGAGGRRRWDEGERAQKFCGARGLSGLCVTNRGM